MYTTNVTSKPSFVQNNFMIALEIVQPFIDRLLEVRLLSKKMLYYLLYVSRVIQKAHAHLKLRR